MATQEIGIRIDPAQGLAYLGVEELNKRIAAGARVVEVRPGGAIMAKTGESGDQVRLTLSGCKFEVVLIDS